MAKNETDIYVVSEPKETQPKGDWSVRLGSPKGEIVSSHRQKGAAVKRGRSEGNKRARDGRKAVLKVFNRSNGAYEVRSRYGPGR